MADCSISIIIPAYNVEKYLKAALDSIKQQTELPDEVILIDDGSTDRTLEVAKTYEIPVSYHVISIENGGQGNARNLGVSLASSEYVYFFDSDDLLTEDFISSIKGQIRYYQHPDIILFSGESFNDCEYQGDRWVNYCRSFSGVFINRTDFLDQAQSHNALFCSPCLYVSKKSMWGTNGLEFGRNFLEDDALFYPVLFACRSIAVIDEVFFLRRNREGSTMTMAPNAKHVKGALNCMRTTLRLYETIGLTTKEQWHIRRRIESHCSNYIIMARRACLRIKFSEVFNAIVKTKSPKLALKAFLYATRADQSDVVRGIWRFAKKIGGLAKSNA